MNQREIDVMRLRSALRSSEDTMKAFEALCAKYPVAPPPPGDAAMYDPEGRIITCFTSCRAAGAEYVYRRGDLRKSAARFIRTIGMFLKAAGLGLGRRP